jgi:leucyl/phenylalanyl-tRNA--protein transferase
MTELAWLAPDATPEQLPSIDRALREPDGLLAAGGNLSQTFLLGAYRRGIFPWYERGQPILWWSPDPRAVLLPVQFKISRSLAKTIRKSGFLLSCDTAFSRVIDACAEPRNYTRSTWITAPMRDAYCGLHADGWAHSFEAWRDGELVGGLYGIGIGAVFFGESMFARTSDASKVAFAHAIDYFLSAGIELVDCQLPSPHLASLGAKTIPRADFSALLGRLCGSFGTPGSWSESFAAHMAQSG